MSHETVRRITQNDPALTTLVIAHESSNDRRVWNLVEEGAGLFDPNNRSEIGKIGESIASNTALGNVIIHGQQLANAATATRSHRSFLSGFKRNASIHTLVLMSIDLSQGLEIELLTYFKDRNHPLRRFSLRNCDLGVGNEGVVEMASTLSAFKHVNELRLCGCNVDDQCLQTIIAAISGYELKHLFLESNSIGRAGCGALATILKDPNSKLFRLVLDQNNIDDSCCTALADALKKNNTLKTLRLNQNPQITETGMNAFTEVLCNTTSINATYLSNHTLKEITCHEGAMDDNLLRLLRVNNLQDKKLAAMWKILARNCLNITPFFEWDLKLLPYFIAWIDEFNKRTKELFESDEDIAELTAVRLSGMYRFVRAMPLLCIPSHKKRGLKRKLEHLAV